MSIHNKLNLFIKNFLMLDVYENMSDEDKEFISNKIELISYENI